MKWRKMEIKLENLISYEKLKAELGYVFSMAEQNESVVILKDNSPAFTKQKYDAKANSITKSLAQSQNYTLHEAMHLVLLEKEDHTMHAAELADEIYERRLYVKENGEKAEYTQERARCGKYHEILNFAW